MCVGVNVGVGMGVNGWVWVGGGLIGFEAFQEFAFYINRHSGCACTRRDAAPEATYVEMPLWS